MELVWICQNNDKCAPMCRDVYSYSTDEHSILISEQTNLSTIDILSILPDWHSWYAGVRLTFVIRGCPTDILHTRMSDWHTWYAGVRLTFVIRGCPTDIRDTRVPDWHSWYAGARLTFVIRGCPIEWYAGVRLTFVIRGCPTVIRDMRVPDWHSWYAGVRLTYVIRGCPTDIRDTRVSDWHSWYAVVRLTFVMCGCPTDIRTAYVRTEETLLLEQDTSVKWINTGTYRSTYKVLRYISHPALCITIRCAVYGPNVSFITFACPFIS
jgi:hypothetical protein